MQIEQKRNKNIIPTSVYTLSAEETNQVTTELENLINAAGLTPSASDLTQVRESVKLLGSPKLGAGLSLNTRVLADCYTTVGTPTITDNVISGITTTSFIKSKFTFNNNTPLTDFEIQAKCVRPSTMTERNIAINYETSSGSTSGIGFHGDGRPTWVVGRDSVSGSDKFVTYPNAVTAGVEYYLRGVLKNGTATLYIDSVDGTFSQTATLNVSSCQFSPTVNRGFGIGHSWNNSNTGYVFTESIDLKETFVKVNGKNILYPLGETYLESDFALEQDYQNGTSFCKIFRVRQADGTFRHYCEQGGRAEYSNSTTVNVTFLQSFKETDYFVTCSSILGASLSSTGYSFQNSQCANLSVSGFTTYVTNNFPKTWYACGYID